ncbi:MAG TPA: cytochrome c3 family protein [Vicinamibacterales bacterium]
MPQIFHRSTNTIARVTILGAVGILTLVSVLLAIVFRADYMTEVRVIREQPVPFSHKHHVSGVGIDCRYCHTSVETSSFAGLPPTATCMTCHSEIWTGSPMLEPVRASLRTNEPLRWTRVHDLPDFVYFDHSIHLAKGIGCSTCHGRVDQMPIMWRENSLLMEWCLNCHRQPEQYVRPRSAVFQMDWVAPPNQLEAGRELVQTYHIRKLTDCYTCHR